MLALQDYAIFSHLQQSGVPLRASTCFGEGLAAALWEREGRGHYRYDPANHHTLSFWVAGGAGFRRLRGRDYDPIHGESSFWVVPAGAPTAWEAAGKGRLLHFYIPKPVFESRVVETLDADPGLINLREEGLQHDPSLENIIRSMVLPLSWEEPADRIAITQAGEMLTTYLAARCSERPPRSLFIRGGLAPAVLRRVQEYVEAHLEQDLTIEDLAAVAGLSPYHFTRAFKRSTGLRSLSLRFAEPDRACQAASYSRHETAVPRGEGLRLWQPKPFFRPLPRGNRSDPAPVWPLLS